MGGTSSHAPHVQIPTIALLAAMLLMTMSLPLAFVSLRNLLERDVLKSFYCRHQDQSDAYYRVGVIVSPTG